MEKKSETVLLRDIDSQKSKAFEPEHAKRLLALPNSRWRLVGEEPEIGLAKLPEALDHHVRAAKPHAAAAKHSPVAAAPPEADTTGQPTTV